MLWNVAHFKRLLSNPQAGWLPVERQWLEVLLSSLIPGDDDYPACGALDDPELWSLFATQAPLQLELGLRSSVWVLSWLPVLYLEAPCTLGALPRAQRERLLSWAANSDSYPLRQMMLTLKAMACFLYFRDPQVVERLGV